MSDEPRLRIAICGGVGRATLARPSVQNPLDKQTVVELRQAFDEFDADGDVRAVLIAGEGDDFCAGSDLAATLEETEGGVSDDVFTLGRLFLGVRQMTKPVSAAVCRSAPSPAVRARHCVRRRAGA